ncbi:MAG: endolytic transglycosylase MltG [Deltaproteobacteria bacterium]|nr:endolytic transglycosylase MltG [Deltaproteobacteria bacterium]
MKRFFAVTIVGLLCGLFVIGVNIYYYGNVVPEPEGGIGVETHPYEVEEEKYFSFERGTRLSEIIRRLEEGKIIRDSFLFKVYVVVHWAASKIRAGDYLFKPGLTPSQVLDLLLKGDFKVYEIRIIEGWTLKEIASYLEGMGLVSQERFLAKCRDRVFIQSLGFEASSLEGYLFPETYRSYRKTTEEELIRKFVSQFKRRFGPELQAKVRELEMTEQAVLTLASIIEKETGRREERPIISSVFHNRLREGIPLAADPTVIYGVPNFNGNLRRSDLETPTPYNTYLFKGLPPGPIASPGLDSILAALNPAQTEYLYFVAKGDGTHEFSKTLQEHESAIRKYQITQNRPL